MEGITLESFTPAANKFYPVTNCVNLEEAALDLVETVRKTPDERARHRYQEIHVIRNGRRAIFTRDLGEITLDKLDAFHVLAGGQEDGKFWSAHTVREVIDIADQMRVNRPFDKEELMYAPSNRRKQALARIK